MRRTKIIATAGPASQSPEMLARLIEAGVDVFRLNFSHGKTEDHARVLEHVHAASKQAGRSVGMILVRRIENESMRKMDMPADAHYGASTRRAIFNFPISDMKQIGSLTVPSSHG